MNVDERLLAVLAATGHYDADGVHRGARPGVCRDCRRPVLLGLDADRCACVAVVDPHEIDPVGEILAVRIGLMTYNLTHSYSAKGKRRWILDTRMVCMIEAPRRSAVVAAHRCGLAIPAAKAIFHSPPPKPAHSLSVPPF